MLLPNGWAVLATYYVYAVRSLGVKVCPNTKLAKTNVLVCEEFAQRFEEKIGLLFNAQCKVDITKNGYEIVSNGRKFRFDEGNETLLGAFNKFIQYLCLNEEIFRKFDHGRRVLDFLLANNSK